MGRLWVVLMVAGVLLTPGCGRKAREQRLREEQARAAAAQAEPDQVEPRPLPEQVAPYHASRLPPAPAEPIVPSLRLSGEEQEQLAQLLPGCFPDVNSTREERILYCPGQALYFAVRDVDERSPDAAFNQWLEEFNQRAYGTLEVLERTEVKHFGPQMLTLYYRLRTPQLAPGEYLEAYVALTEVNGKRRRVWCSASHAEPMGRQRCEADLGTVALIDPPHP